VRRTEPQTESGNKFEQGWYHKGDVANEAPWMKSLWGIF